jgi:hypothetical protein
MHRDFKELLSAFNAGKVRYLIVGGYAVSYHAQPRATKDLDILIGADAENSKGVYAALAKFGAPIEGLSPKDFAEPDNFFRMGTPPVMVDIMPKISGVEFDEAWSRRVDVQIDDAAKTGSNYGNNKRERILWILPIAPPTRIRMPSQIICRDALIKGWTTICNR